MRTLSLFFHCIRRALLAKRKDAAYWAGVDLLKKRSFRNPEKEHEDPLIGLRWLKRTLGLIRTTGVFSASGKGDEDVAFFDGASKGEEDKLAYIEAWTGERPSLRLYKSRALNVETAREAWALRFLTFIAFLGVFPFTLFSSSRGNWALLIRELPEVHNLYRTLKRKGIRKLYFFFIHEPDANLSALLLQRAGVEVVKVPNGNPLMPFNRVLITDKLCLTLPYQEEELEAFRESLFYESVETWSPFEVFPYQALYIGSRKDRSTEKTAIGLYSHGVIARELEGHMIPEHGDLEAEKRMLPLLAAYLEQKGHWIKVFLHPKEKGNKDFLAQAESLYQERLRTERVLIADPGRPSYETFDEVEVGVGAFSSILFERFYFGFKTVFVPIGMDFPIEGSPMERICAKDEAGLFRVLDEQLRGSAQELFREKDLERYTCAGILTEKDRFWALSS